MSLSPTIGLKLAVILSIIAAVCLTSCWADQCNNFQENISAKKRCYSRAGLAEPTVYDTFTPSTREFLFERILAAHGDTLCSPATISRFESALVCGIQITLACLTGRLQTSAAQRFASIIHPLCAHRHDLQLQCVNRNAKGVNDCEQGYKGQVTQCKSLAITIACIKRNFEECGCQTSKVYSDAYVDLMLPPSCPRAVLQEHRVVCNASRPNEFVYKGFSNSCPLTFSTTITALILGLCFLVAIVF